MAEREIGVARQSHFHVLDRSTHARQKELAVAQRFFDTVLRRTRRRAFARVHHAALTDAAAAGGRNGGAVAEQCVEHAIVLAQKIAVPLEKKTHHETPRLIYLPSMSLRVLSA